MDKVRIPESMKGLAEALGRIPSPEEALTMFMKPIRTAIARRDEALAALAERFEVDSMGDKVAGYSWGEGRAIVLAHGWNGRALSMAAFVQPLVDRGFRVIALDAPGHGESEGEICHAPRFAECIAQLPDRFGPIYALMGHSFGTIASTVAQARGLAVEKAVYLSALCWIPERFREFAAAVGLKGDQVEEVWARADELFGPGQIERFNADCCGGEVFLAGLLVHCEEDKEVLIDQSEAIVKVWRGSELWRVQGLGHFRILRSRIVVERVVSFLAG